MGGMDFAPRYRPRFRHSQADDLELRYSLRSVETYLPYVRKVSTFGDRPDNPMRSSAGCPIAGMRCQNSDDSRCFASRAELGSAPGEVEKCQDGIFQRGNQFLTRDTTRVEHVPHEYLARLGPYRTPLRNGFLMLFLASLLPELDREFLLFCDELIRLDGIHEQDFKRLRVHQDLRKVEVCGRGLLKEALWRIVIRR